MHELSITRNIVATVAEHARGRKVSAVTLKIGKLSGVEVRAIRFCFDVCCQGTALEGATLHVDEIPGVGRCQRCEERMELPHLVAICPCEKRSKMTIETGEELLIHSMEVG